jgi:hypothetical protein
MTAVATTAKAIIQANFNNKNKQQKNISDNDHDIN